MSKLFKSKFLMGVMVVAAMFVGVGALTAEAQQPVVSASDVQYAATVQMGSVGQASLIWQKFLNGYSSANLVADSKFGPLSSVALKVWQASRNLSADGVAGAMSRASAVAQINGGAPIGGSTGALCPNGMTLASNCTLAPNAQAQPLCPNGMTLASNCMTSPTGTPSTGGPLTGGAGDVTVTELSSPSSAVKVGEGDVATQVFGIEYEADDGSDLALTSMKLTLSSAGTGSKRLDRYAKSVSIWYNNVKVGSANVADFSEASSVYTKSINLSGVVIKAGEIGKVYVAVNAVDNIDSGDVGSAANTWTVTLSSTRYEDATGVVLTDSTTSINNTFVFDSLSNTSDVELKVSLASGSPVSSTVRVSTTADTSRVELLKFTLKAQGSDMKIDAIPVYFTTSESDLDEVTSNVTLSINGQTFNESVSTSASASTTVLFNNLDLAVLKAGDTITGTIFADINDIETTLFDEGMTLSAQLRTAEVVTVAGTNGIDVEDVNGDQLVTGDRTGSAVGNTLTFRSTGVNTVMGTPTYERTTDTSGLVTSVTYTIPVAVTSFGNTLFVGQTAQLATAASLSNAFALILETAAAPTTESVSATTSITLSSSNALVETNGYRLDDGQPKNFVVKVTMTAATDNTSIRFRLDTIRTFTEAGLVTATNSDLLPTTNFRTDFQYINN